jgi:predicted DNA-binding protein YlxM (UPF0122 family)
MLDKTNRMNLLYDFYHTLLTDKQKMILEYYFGEDYSLAEIAEEMNVSRQAIFEHIKRAEATMEQLESQLALVAKFEQRRDLLQQFEIHIQELADPLSREELLRFIDQLKQLDD